MESVTSPKRFNSMKIQVFDVVVFFPSLVEFDDLSLTDDHIGNWENIRIMKNVHIDTTLFPHAVEKTFPILKSCCFQ